MMWTGNWVQNRSVMAFNFDHSHHLGGLVSWIVWKKQPFTGFALFSVFTRHRKRWCELYSRKSCDEHRHTTFNWIYVYCVFRILLSVLPFGIRNDEHQWLLIIINDYYIWKTVFTVVKMLEISSHSIWVNKSISPFLFACIRTMNNERMIFVLLQANWPFPKWIIINNLSTETVPWLLLIVV